MFKILVTDSLSTEGVKVFTDAGFQADVRNDLTPETLLEVIADYDAIVIRSKTRVTKEVLAVGKKLKVIGRAGVGLDNVDIPAATQRGVAVMNTPGGNSVSTAEHTFSMIMSLVRNIPQAVASMNQKKWEKKKFVGRELRGKVLGVIGLGRIGKTVAARAKAFGMRIYANDAFISKEATEGMGFTYATFEQIIKEADIITVHTPLTSETKGLLNTEQFKYMKDGVFVVNCARGGIIDEAALIEALDSGKVAGAALDVYPTEPPENWDAVVHPKVIATPHLGASTTEAQVIVAVQVAEQISTALKDKVFVNAVNVPALDKETLLKLENHVVLGEKLGYFTAQLIKGAVRKIKVKYSGEDLIKENISPITTAIAKGFLDYISDTPVNYINAASILKGMEVEIVETKVSEAHDYTNLISVEIVADDGSQSVCGTVFGKKDIRIVRINDYFLDLDPQGNILVIRNEDKPGFIGAIGSLLGSEGINVGFMTVGRKEAGTTALTVITTDNCIADHQMKKIKDIEHVATAKTINMS